MVEPTVVSRITPPAAAIVSRKRRRSSPAAVDGAVASLSRSALAVLVLVPAVRQLLAWRVRLPVVAALLLLQTLAVQVLFATRW
jgi:hypothetical protein